MFSLTEGIEGTTYSLVKIEHAAEQHAHLINLGFIKHADVTIITHNQDDYILLVHNSRVAVNKNIVANLLVTEKDHQLESDLHTLDTLPVGTTIKVERILGKGSVRRRLMDMGLTKGVPVLIRKVAPLGDPIEISVRNYELTLRKNEASLVLVKE